jgi:hypothetical protein
MVAKSLQKILLRKGIEGAAGNRKVCIKEDPLRILPGREIAKGVFPQKEDPSHLRESRMELLEGVTSISGSFSSLPLPQEKAGVASNRFANHLDPVMVRGRGWRLTRILT